MSISIRLVLSGRARGGGTGLFIVLLGPPQRSSLLSKSKPSRSAHEGSSSSGILAEVSSILSRLHYQLFLILKMSYDRRSPSYLGTVCELQW